MRIVSCHLGAGVPRVAAIVTGALRRPRRWVHEDRAGDAIWELDPGLLLWLLEPHRAERGAAARARGRRRHDSGCSGFAGRRGWRDVVSGAATGEPRARLALGRLRASTAIGNRVDGRGARRTGRAGVHGGRRGALAGDPQCRVEGSAFWALRIKSQQLRGGEDPRPFPLRRRNGARSSSRRERDGRDRGAGAPRPEGRTDVPAPRQPRPDPDSK